MKWYYYTIPLLLLVILPTTTQAAWVAISDFEGLSDGDLNGQSDGSGWSAAWSGDTLYDVQGTTVYEGSKAGALNAGATEPAIGRSLTTGQVSGEMRYVIQRDTTANGSFSLFMSNGTPYLANISFYVQFGGSAVINLNGTSVGSYSADTWHIIDVNFDLTVDEAMVAVDEGSYSSPVSITHKTSIDGLGWFFGAAGPASWQYFDYIGPTPAAAPETTTETPQPIKIDNGSIHINNGSLIIE